MFSYKAKLLFLSLVVFCLLDACSSDDALKSSVVKNCLVEKLKSLGLDDSVASQQNVCGASDSDMQMHDFSCHENSLGQIVQLLQSKHANVQSAGKHALDNLLLNYEFTNGQERAKALDLFHQSSGRGISYAFFIERLKNDALDHQIKCWARQEDRRLIYNGKIKLAMQACDLVILSISLAYLGVNFLE